MLEPRLTTEPTKSASKMGAKGRRPCVRQLVQKMLKNRIPSSVAACAARIFSYREAFRASFGVLLHYAHLRQPRKCAHADIVSACCVLPGRTHSRRSRLEFQVCPQPAEEGWCREGDRKRVLAHAAYESWWTAHPASARDAVGAHDCGPAIDRIWGRGSTGWGRGRRLVPMPEATLTSCVACSRAPSS